MATGRLQSFATEFLQCLEDGGDQRVQSPIAVASAVIARQRRDDSKQLGFSRADIEAIRARVTPEEQASADEQFAAALESDLFMPFHNNAFAALGPITLNLAMTETNADAVLRKVMANDDGLDRSRWIFGETTAVCELISFLWANDRVPDEVFIPLFVWLARQSRAEWAHMGTASEASLGNAGHNWWLYSYYGFWFMGTFFGFLKGAARFEALMPHYYEWELHNLFGEDGWSIEESPNYHLFAARYALKIEELCRLNGIDIGDRSRALIGNVARSLVKLVAPDMQYPGFSDSVVGRRYPGFHEYLRYELANDVYFRRIAALHGLGDLKYVIESLGCVGDLRGTVWAHLGDLQQAYDALPATPPEDLDTCLTENGLYAMRDSWTPDAHYLAIQAGPGGTAEKSHKQSDIFNVELYSHGDRVIVDNWYGPAEEMSKDRRPRLWRISTDAHNTVSVDGRDQLEILNEWRYANVVLPMVQEWESTPETCYFHGVHDAYSRLRPDPVSSHRRKIFFLRNRLWIIIDRLVPGSEASHDYALLFHLKPEAELRPDRRLVTTSDRGNVLLVPWCNHELSLSLRDNPYPWEGYENPRQLRCETSAAGPVIFVTLIIPFKGCAIPEASVIHHPVHADERILAAWEASALTVRTGDLKLDYVDLHTHWTLPWQAGPLQGSCRRLHRVS